jgi:Family of unknown function (DUF6011)
MERCKVCRKTLTNPASKKFGYGPECLKRAVAEGNAPLESLEELKAWKKVSKKTPRIAQENIPERCENTIDMFESGRASAIEALKRAVAECEAAGVQVTYKTTG